MKINDLNTYIDATTNFVTSKFCNIKAIELTLLHCKPGKLLASKVANFVYGYSNSSRLYAYLTAYETSYNARKMASCYCDGYGYNKPAQAARTCLEKISVDTSDFIGDDIDIIIEFYKALIDEFVKQGANKNEYFVKGL